MKKSTIFIIIFLVISAIGAQVSNFILGKKYENIDKSNPYLGRKKIELPPFKHLKIYNNDNDFGESVFVRPGDDFCFWTRVDTSKIAWYTESDTLFMELKALHLKGWDGSTPDIYLQAPHIAGVTVKNGYCKIEGWNVPNLNVHIGNAGGTVPEVMLAENTIESLSVRMKCDSCLRIGNGNKIANSKIERFGL